MLKTIIHTAIVYTIFITLYVNQKLSNILNYSIIQLTI